MSAPCVLQSTSCHVSHDLFTTSLMVVPVMLCKGQPKLVDPAPAVLQNIPQKRCQTRVP